ncbi:MAG: hypothetical protein V4451_05985 [Pseudomonadota bacterium]
MYHLNPFGLVICTADGSTVPTDEESPKYQAYVAWVAEGNTAQPQVRPLDELKTKAQAAIDDYYRHLYYATVPNTAIAAEYDAAYMVAKRWLDNQALPVPERVKALAESYGVTNLQAAGVVVEKWTEAQAVAFDLRGAARLRAKLAIRNAANAAGVAAAEQAGREAMEDVVFSI